MNIILKSFLITLTVMSAVTLILLANILPSWYGLIVLFVLVFTIIWFFVYIMIE